MIEGNYQGKNPGASNASDKTRGLNPKNNKSKKASKTQIDKHNAKHEEANKALKAINSNPQLEEDVYKQSVLARLKIESPLDIPKAIVAIPLFPIDFLYNLTLDFIFVEPDGSVPIQQTNKKRKNRKRARDLIGPKPKKIKTSQNKKQKEAASTSPVSNWFLAWFKKEEKTSTNLNTAEKVELHESPDNGKSLTNKDITQPAKIKQASESIKEKANSNDSDTPKVISSSSSSVDSDSSTTTKSTEEAKKPDRSKKKRKAKSKKPKYQSKEEAVNRFSQLATSVVKGPKRHAIVNFMFEHGFKLVGLTHSEDLVMRRNDDLITVRADNTGDLSTSELKKFKQDLSQYKGLNQKIQDSERKLKEFNKSLRKAGGFKIKSSVDDISEEKLLFKVDKVSKEQASKRLQEVEKIQGAGSASQRAKRLEESKQEESSTQSKRRKTTDRYKYISCSKEEYQNYINRNEYLDENNEAEAKLIKELRKNAELKRDPHIGSFHEGRILKVLRDFKTQKTIIGFAKSKKDQIMDDSGIDFIVEVLKDTFIFIDSKSSNEAVKDGREERGGTYFINPSNQSLQELKKLILKFVTDPKRVFKLSDLTRSTTDRSKMIKLLRQAQKTRR